MLCDVFVRLLISNVTAFLFQDRCRLLIVCLEYNTSDYTVPVSTTV